MRPQTGEAVAQERFLDQETWAYLKACIGTSPQEITREIESFERLRFLFHFFYLPAPRVSEVAGQPMNSFREFRGKWWWYVEGKGGKKAKVPVNDEMLDALMRYRRFLSMSDLPSEDDISAIFRSIKGTKAVSGNMVYRLVRKAVAAAADNIEAKNPLSARKLRRTSTHWSRHTAVTHGDDNGVGIKYIQASARHEKMENTSIYQHAEDHKWHNEWQRLWY